MNHNFLIINIMIHHTFYQMCNCTHYYKCVIVHITTLQSRRKMCQTIFRDNSREISDLSRYIGDFPRYIAWSTRSQRSQRATVKVKSATVSRPKQFASEGIWTPNQKVWVIAFLPSGLTRPYDIKCIKHIYT